jgi:hypothetical protein
MRRWLKDKARKHAVIYTLDDKVLDGVLAVVADEGVVLNNTVIHDATDIPLPGDVFIPRENIRFVQIARARQT